jgi:hypothetical protein
MNEQHRPRLNEKVITGGFLVLLGVLFILDNFQVIDAGALWDYWPLFLIAPGLSRLLQPERPGQRMWGAILVGVGGVLLLRNLDIVWIPFHRVWPVALVVVGGYLIWQTVSPRALEGKGGAAVSLDATRAGVAATLSRAAADIERGVPGGVGGIAQLNEFALCGGGHRIVQSSDFRGGTVTVIAGGFDIDLRQAVMARESARIEVFVMMGGVVLRIPEGWKVELNVTPLLGGTDMKARTVPPAEGTPKILTISGFILMGGVEVKN